MKNNNLIDLLPIGLRKFSSSIARVRSFVSIHLYQWRYPSVSLSGCFLEEGVKVYCSNESTIQVHNSVLSRGVTISAKHGGRIRIDNCFIGSNSVIVACDKITIGSDSQIAEMVVIRDHNHRYDDVTTPVANQGFTTSPIEIGKSVWVGAKATILAGSVIGDHSVVGAHGLVNSRLDSEAVYVGQPVKKVKDI